MHFRPENELILWNTSIRRYKSLPHSDLPSQRNDRFGFGFDDSSNDYKVVAIFDKSSLLHPITKVFSFRTGQWKNIVCEFPPCWYEARTSGHIEIAPVRHVLQFGNGKFYWLKCYLEVVDDGRALVLLCFVCYLELKTNKYRMFEVPGKENRKSFKHCRLALSEENLVYVLDADSIQADICIMKEDENGVCWTKLSIYLSTISLWGVAKNIILMLNNEEIMWFQTDKCIIFNTKNGSIRWCCMIANPVLEACTYVESLVWLSGEVQPPVQCARPGPRQFRA